MFEKLNQVKSFIAIVLGVASLLTYAWKINNKIDSALITSTEALKIATCNQKYLKDMTVTLLPLFDDSAKFEVMKRAIYNINGG